MNQRPSQSTFKDDTEALSFLYSLTSELYIQLALVTEQVSSLTKILWSKGLVSEEELLVINEDMETVIEQFAGLGDTIGNDETEDDTEEE